MCGICGVVPSDPGREFDPALLRRMNRLLHHRGPDSEGYYSAPGIALGVRRLSIIDTQTGDQPLANEDGAVVLVCNGEIYNFVELRAELQAAGHRFRSGSDSEVIVHLYEDLGIECLHRLRGMFALALWDSRRRVLLVARDRLGIKPLYYAEGPEGLVFGSEIKPILLAGGAVPRLDLHAVRDLFAFGFTVGPGTFFAGVRRLQPGHYLLHSDAGTTVRRYWQVSFPPRNHPAPTAAQDECAEALLDKLTECVRLHLRSDVPVAAWLSAGIDSSSIVALIAQATGRPVETFSLAFENPDLDEVTGRRTLVDFPGYEMPHQTVVCGRRDFERLPRTLWHCEGISATGIEVLHMILSQATARNYKVVLTGEGSDEVFGGYRWYRLEKLLRPMAPLPLAIRRLTLLGPIMPRFFPGASLVQTGPREMNRKRYQFMVGPGYPGLADGLLSGELRSRLASTPDGEPDPPEGFASWHPHVRLQYQEMTTRLPDYILHHLDHVTMAHSLEARVPFLDHEFVEFCATIPAGLKMKRLREKHILRRAMRPVLPAEVVRRKKRGLRAPFQQWLRETLPDFAADLLSETSLRRKGYFNPAGVQALLERHRAGKGRCGSLLMAVLAVQLWDELFLHRRLEDAPA